MAQGLPDDWLQRAANPLRYEGIVAYRVTRVYADGVEDSTTYAEEDYMIVDSKARDGERNILLRHRELVRADNEAQQQRWREESEAYDRMINHPG